MSINTGSMAHPISMPPSSWSTASLLMYVGPLLCLPFGSHRVTPHLHAQAKQRCCITCEAVFDSSELLLQHMQQQGHFECGSHGETGDHDDDDKYAPLPSHHHYLSIYLPMLL